MNNPSLVYEKLILLIDSIIQNLRSQLKISVSANVTNSISEALSILDPLIDNIKKEYTLLKEIGECERLTIALYGETNAGKSTLVEVLRLALQEKTKIENQKKFKQIQDHYCLTQEEFEKINSMIASNLIKENDINKKLKMLTDSYKYKKRSLTLEIEHLNKEIAKIVSNEKWWHRLLRISKATPKKNIVNTKNYQVNELSEEYKSEKDKLSGELDILLIKKEYIENLKNKFEATLPKLAQFADGKIIGDGRSDFTRNNTIYNFDFSEYKLAIIDVPGIEGAEKNVQELIKQALCKAHIVFYITRSPCPPQTNDKKNIQGTLEKIQRHLSAQTEVWSIYNHPVNNSRQLKKPLLSSDINEGIKEMEHKFRLVLAEMYQGNITISAAPAFWALADCILPGSEEKKSQKKFLEFFNSKKDILELTGLNEFVYILQKKILVNYHSKIIRANQKKTFMVLKDALSHLKNISEILVRSEEEIKDQIITTRSQIQLLLEEFICELRQLCRKIIRKYVLKIRTLINEQIDSGINEVNLKNHIHKVLEIKVEQLTRHINISVKKKIDDLQKEMKSIYTRLNIHVKSITFTYNQSLRLIDLNLNVDLNDKLQIYKLFSQIAEGIFLFLIPAGWTVKLIRLISLSKTIRGLFNKEIKKGQQKENVNKILKEVESSVEENINRFINEIDKQIEDFTNKLYLELNKPQELCTNVINIFNGVYEELDIISKNIKF